MWHSCANMFKPSFKSVSYIDHKSHIQDVLSIHSSLNLLYLLQGHRIAGASPGYCWTKAGNLIPNSWFVHRLCYTITNMLNVFFALHQRFIGLSLQHSLLLLLLANRKETLLHSSASLFVLFTLNGHVCTLPGSCRYLKKAKTKCQLNFFAHILSLSLFNFTNPFPKRHKTIFENVHVKSLGKFEHLKIFCWEFTLFLLLSLSLFPQK